MPAAGSGCSIVWEGRDGRDGTRGRDGRRDGREGREEGTGSTDGKEGQDGSEENIWPENIFAYHHFTFLKFILCCILGSKDYVSNVQIEIKISKVSNEIKIFFRFCPYQRFRIFLFLFSLLLVFSYVLISSLLLTRWKLLLFHFDSSASSFHRKSSVCAAVVSQELLSKKKNHLLVVSELVRVIVLRRKPRVIPSSCHTGRPYATAHIVFIWGDWAVPHFKPKMSPPAITFPFTEPPPIFWDWRIKYFFSYISFRTEQILNR